jgi:hypothetical protein
MFYEVQIVYSVHGCGNEIDLSSFSTDDDFHAMRCAIALARDFSYFSTILKIRVQRNYYHFSFLTGNMMKTEGEVVFSWSPFFPYQLNLFLTRLEDG